MQDIKVLEAQAEDLLDSLDKLQTELEAKIDEVKEGKAELSELKEKHEDLHNLMVSLQDLAAIYEEFEDGVMDDLEDMLEENGLIDEDDEEGDDEE